ncbi:MAG: Xaa-Pro peptidase family protein [Dehalococcoidia bacterium]
MNRLDRVRTRIEEAKLDALLISGPVDDVFGRHSQNREWVSGFSGSTGRAVVTLDRAVMAVDFRYVEQAERECVPRGFEVFKIDGREKQWLPKLVEAADLAGKTVGLSGADITFGGAEALKVAARSMRVGRPRFVVANGIVEGLRKVKDAEELAALQRAIDIGDAACDTAVAALRPGMTEIEVAELIEREVKGGGGEGLSFETIVAAGPWGAMPHASPRNEAIRKGDAVVIDMGALSGGYCSDLTRTVTAGKPDANFQAIYDIVFEAQQAAIEGVEAGMSGVTAHRLASKVIGDAGYGENFGHGLGHGVGLEVHESPYLGESSQDVLEEGMVFTIEPGIYLPGWGGVRIEDVVVLENGKARVLSHAKKMIPAGVS